MGRGSPRPGRRSASSTRRGRTPNTPVGRVGGEGGGAGGGRGRGGSFACDPWAVWVLENYSLYTTILAAFTRKAVNMSFKVREKGRFAGFGWVGARFFKSVINRK